VTFTENPFPFKKQFPFLLELLQFEWLEIEVFMMEDADIPRFVPESTSKQKILVGNPEIKILGLQYPIHTKKPRILQKQI
jgi:hypothetical protein